MREALRRRRRGFRLVSQTGARVVPPGRLQGPARWQAMLPSLFTLANMLCGFASVFASFDGRYQAAAVLIGVAIVLDILDGAVARAVGAITPFGLQFDSLADLISFGIGPAVLLHTWGFNGQGTLAWVVPLLWLACAAFRLARFNVTIDPLADKRYFIGLASPAAAGVALATVSLFAPPFDGWRMLIPLGTGVLAALLMSSSYRFMSFRMLISPAGVWVPVSLGMFLLAVVGFATVPAITGAIIAYGYVLVCPLGALTAPVRRQLFGPGSVAPPRRKLPSVLFPEEDADDGYDDEEETQSAALIGDDEPADVDLRAAQDQTSRP
ncbi:phosphatidylcholine/phosphatidylserine synthase [Blastococcus sp. Marseille-P5729]|uniref:CDP-alcohol phosphatidyltransferase family protein n=1 Tax=Blastococcus sp. Marseille-P5729 TaxID=2086582 RepID=UPI0018FE73C1|nr:phosphatidylcholine/phosphatidylserine synthase [Blastococcus sp. Marseille-P5729]